MAARRRSAMPRVARRALAASTAASRTRVKSTSQQRGCRRHSLPEAATAAAAGPAIRRSSAKRRRRGSNRLCKPSGLVFCYCRRERHRDDPIPPARAPILAWRHGVFHLDQLVAEVLDEEGDQRRQDQQRDRAASDRGPTAKAVARPMKSGPPPNMSDIRPATVVAVVMKIGIMRGLPRLGQASAEGLAGQAAVGCARPAPPGPRPFSSFSRISCSTKSIIRIAAFNTVPKSARKPRVLHEAQRDAPDIEPQHGADDRERHGQYDQHRLDRRVVLQQQAEEDQDDADAQRRRVGALAAGGFLLDSAVYDPVAGRQLGFDGGDLGLDLRQDVARQQAGLRPGLDPQGAFALGSG